MTLFCVYMVFRLLVFCLNTTHTVSVSSRQVGLAHYKRGCLAPPLSHLSYLSLASCSPFSPFLPHSLHVVMASCHFSTAFICLYYSLNSLPYTLNKLYSILYCHVVVLSQGRDASVWVHWGSLLPHTPPEYILRALALFMITTLIIIKDIYFFYNFRLRTKNRYTIMCKYFLSISLNWVYPLE